MLITKPVPFSDTKSYRKDVNTSVKKDLLFYTNMTLHDMDDTKQLVSDM